MVAPHRPADLGLAILRIGIGLYFFAYGLSKLLEGPEKWAKIGAAMEHFGIAFWPQAWGFAAGLTECCGGILLALGLLFRPTCIGLSLVMAVACVTKAAGASGLFAGFMAMSHPAQMLILFISLSLIGPGAYALDRRYRMTLTARHRAPRRDTTSTG